MLQWILDRFDFPQIYCKTRRVKNLIEEGPLTAADHVNDGHTSHSISPLLPHEAPTNLIQRVRTVLGELANFDAGISSHLHFFFNSLSPSAYSSFRYPIYISCFHGQRATHVNDHVQIISSFLIASRETNHATGW